MRASSERLSMSSKHGRKLQGAGQVLDDLQVRRADQFGQQFLVVQNVIAQPVRAFFVELVALHRGEHGAENFRAENVGKGVVAFLGQPEQQFAAGGVLADEPGERFLEHGPFCPPERAGWRTRGRAWRRPCSVARRTTSCQCSGLAALKDSSARRCLAAGSCFHQRAELERPATQIASRLNLVLGGRQRPPSPAMSSRTKIASSATAGCVRW